MLSSAECKPRVMPCKAVFLATSILQASLKMARGTGLQIVCLPKENTFMPSSCGLQGACVAGNQTMLVMEYVEGGDLWRALQRPGSRVAVWQPQGRKVALDIARGLCFLHAHSIVYAHPLLLSPDVKWHCLPLPCLSEDGILFSVSLLT